MEGNAHLGEALERAAAKDPARLALSDAKETLTYGEMLTEARALASSLPGGPDDRRPIATLMPSNARGVVAILACLIAGRPYCVLNPAQPRRRLEELLGAVEPSVVWVADPSQRQKLAAVGLPVATPRASARRARSWKPPPRDEDELSGIYVTSGSTGTPKVVGYRHASTHHRVGQYLAGLPSGGSHDLGSGHRFALASPLGTAAAAPTLFAALFTRAELHLFDLGVTRPDALAERIRTTKPTVWQSTPSVFRRLAGQGALDGNYICIVRLTGEPMLASDVELAQRTCGPDAWLIDVYGLTETNGAATQRAIPLGDSELAMLTTDSGFPLDGVEVRIEGEDGAPLPSGQEGEIVIGGDFNSAGYLDSDSTRVGTRFTRENGCLVVHTGDRGALNDDGSLLVKGRSDRRVKIWGHRVDPSEVEAAALRLKGVWDAAAVPFSASEQAATALALFATGGPQDALTSASIRSHLRQVLQPEAMPAQVTVLEAIPQTPAGKVDRMRLTTLASESAKGHPPANRRIHPLSIHLASLWSEALEIAPPGPEEDFFALGGDSLAALEVCTAIEDVYGVELEPATLLDYRSPRALAEHVRRMLDGASPSPTRILRLNPRGPRTPIFAIPGAGADATTLVHFADAIGPEQPVNVIQLPGVGGRTGPLSSMDDIAAYCLSVMKESGVPPPYRIAGSSFGGLAAFHTAATLLREGGDVAYVGLFDTSAPGMRKGHYLLRPLFRLRDPDFTSRAFAENHRGWRDRARRVLRDVVAEYRMVAGILLGRRWTRVGHRFRHLRIGCEMAADRWKPRASPVSIHLYRCDSQPSHLAEAPLLGWDDLAANISMRSLQSRHRRHIRPPDVHQLAALVREDLRGADQEATVSGRSSRSSPSPSIASTSSSLSPSRTRSGGTIAANSTPKSPS